MSLMHDVQNDHVASFEGTTPRVLYNIVKVMSSTGSTVVVPQHRQFGDDALRAVVGSLS